MTRNRNIRNATKFKRSIKAISPVIATLLMIAIAVVASLVAYAWVMGYLNFTTEKTGKAVQIQSVSYNPTGNVFTVYVQNVGDSDVEFPASASVFINGALANPITVTGLTGDVLDKGNTATFTATAVAASGLVDGTVQSVVVKITTLDGTFSQITKQFTIGSGGPTPTPGPTATPTPTPGPTATPTPTTITLRPSGTASGGSEQLDEDYSGTDNWECVEEVTSDGDSYYVYDGDDSNGYDTDYYTTQNHGSESGTINSVTIWMNARKSGSSTSDSYARTVVRITGVNYFGSGNTLGDSYAQFSTTYNTDPSGGAWTWTDIDALEIGVSLDSGDTSGGTQNVARCTQVWVVVNYTP